MVPAGKVRPSAVVTLAAAVAAVTVVPAGAASMTACTRVVNGLTVVEPAGALKLKVLGTPVSMLTPPTAMMVPVGAVVGR